MKERLHLSQSRRYSPSQNTSRAGRGRFASPTRSHDQSLPAFQRPARGSHRQKAVPACDRCRSFKKKCSRTFPVCSLYASTGRECSYSTAPATSEAEVVQLRARVQWLSDFINHNLLATHHGEDIENVKTGSDLAELLGSQLGVNPANSANLQFKAQSQKAFITIPSSNLAQPQVRTGILSSTPAELTSSNHRSRGLNVQDKASSRTSPTNTGSADLAVGHVSYRNSAGTDQATEGFVVGHGRAPDAAARRFIDAYFRNVDRAYPFVNQAKILKNLETMGDLSFKTRSLLCCI